MTHSKIMGERLHYWKRQNSKSQTELATRLGTSQVTVQRWESGNAKVIRIDHLVGLADIMGVSLDYLLGRECASKIGGSDV
jgi:transcriptional regulator with XRE-family HTH domain